MKGHHIAAVSLLVGVVLGVARGITIDEMYKQLLSQCAQELGVL